jgi:hypothetical protein
VRKRIGSSGLGSLGSGAVTGLALAVQTIVAAIAGVIVARNFGYSAETDGFFAAYAVYIVVVLAASAIRVVVLPPLARAREERQLGSEVAAYAVTVALLAVPLLVIAIVAAEQVSSLLIGGGSEEARETAAALLPWIVLAGVLQLYAGLAASTLAALDDYTVAAAGYILGSVSGLVLILARVDADGIEAVAWGMALQGVIVVAVPVAVLVLRARSALMPMAALQPSEISFRSRLPNLGSGIAIAFALQAIYLVCVPLAGREGEGAQTSFGYAYLIASAVVAASASSLGLVTAVPLTRVGLDAARSARHIVASSWPALVAVGGAVGVFAVAGGTIVHALLGPAYGDDVGSELSRLVVALAPWAFVTVAISVTFPLVFVAGRTGKLPLLALGAFALHVPLAVVGQLTLGLEGLALALAATTAVVLVSALALLGALSVATRGLLVAALVVAAFAAGAFAAPALALGSTVAAAAIGAALYAGLLGAMRPAPLVAAWHYLRALT